ncbi:MAG: ATP-dependent protease ATPase subunit HslU, partial [Atribacterota bacterium]
MTLEEFTPSEIVAELDKYIVGQKQAKEAVAIALRNRIRRKKLPKALMEEITPKNIIMIGPTGVGKTEIARRLAKLVQAPFIKVEATKFTEVGYVGKDVDSMIRDLTQAAVQLVRKEKIGEVREKAKERVEERILQALLPIRQQDINEREEMVPKNDEIPTPQSVNSRNRENNIIKTENRVGNRDSQKERFLKTKERLRTKLKNGELEEREINIEIEEQGHTSIDIFSNIGMEGIGVDFKEFLDKMIPGRKKRRKIKISEAKKILLDDELEKLLDMNEIAKEAVYRTEELGIVFIDEIDKIAMKEKSYGPDVSRGGVQRDILPIIEGSTVMTKYGAVKTDYILFIAAGAFNASKPSDLIPELQGRFPLRVELNSLHQEDLEKILVE